MRVLRSISTWSVPLVCKPPPFSGLARIESAVSKPTLQTASSGRSTGKRKKAGDPGDRQPLTHFGAIECAFDERLFDQWQLSSRIRWKRRIRHIRWKLHNHHQR